MVALAPALVYALSLPAMGRLQRNDYYGTLPVLLWMLNARATRGDNRALAACALLLHAAALAAVMRLLPAGVRRRAPAHALVGAAACALLFTPVAAHNVVLGFSGTLWFGANALAIWAISALVRGPRAPVAQTARSWRTSAWRACSRTARAPRCGPPW